MLGAHPPQGQPGTHPWALDLAWRGASLRVFSHTHPDRWVTDKSGWFPVT